MTTPSFLLLYLFSYLLSVISYDTIWNLKLNLMKVKMKSRVWLSSLSRGCWQEGLIWDVQRHSPPCTTNSLNVVGNYKLHAARLRAVAWQGFFCCTPPPPPPPLLFFHELHCMCVYCVYFLDNKGLFCFNPTQDLTTGQWPDSPGFETLQFCNRALSKNTFLVNIFCSIAEFFLERTILLII